MGVLWVWVVLAGSTALQVVSGASATVHITGLGSVHGVTGTTAWTNRTTYNYYNIPYAQSPAITGRFKPPVKVGPWDDIYNATIPRRACPQLSLLQRILESKDDEDFEDCLTMNIFTPQPPNVNRSKLLPVMVYIHGGGFYQGETTDFPPDYLLETDVLLVVPQYRLTVFGTLCLHTEDAPGNALFFDQLLALEWINQHIEDFGGDPNKVTIFGQSAGAASVNMMIISPIVDPKLFQRAIVQSGSAISNWVVQSKPIKYASALYFQLTGKNEPATAEEMLEALENATIPNLLNSYLAIKDPVIKREINRGVIQKAGDRKFITQYPSEYLKTGNFKTLEMMSGVVKNDGSFFSTIVYDTLEPYNLQNNPEYLKNNLTQEVLSMSGVYDHSGAIDGFLKDKFFGKILDKTNLTFSEMEPGLTDILGTIFLKSPTLQLAKANAVFKPTYFYSFDYSGEYTRFGYGADTRKYPFKGGVHHSDELLYLFPFPYTNPLDEEDTRVANIMVDLWTSFAITGIPRSYLIDPDWQPLRKGKDGPYIHINSTCYLDEDFVHKEFDITTKEYYAKKSRKLRHRY